MRVFVAGGSGVVGPPLVRALRAAGHEVTAMTRSPGKAEGLRALGAEPVVCDAYDAGALRAAVANVEPEAVINQLTALPHDFNPRGVDAGPTNRLRLEGGKNLIDAALASGVRRFVTQSIAFLYAPEGDWVKDEDGRPYDDAPPPFSETVRAMLEHEGDALGAGGGLEAVVLRYGQFYGPGTYYASDGGVAAEVRKRRFPIVGRGDGVFSFLHVDDAAAAAVAALAVGAPGVYNVCDDEPAPSRDWLPVYAAAIGAGPPRRVPTWLARLVAGRQSAQFATSMRGALNVKARRELGWTPRWASWRQGFREAHG